MSRQFFCHLQFRIIQSTKLNLECITKCKLDKKKTIETEKCMHLQGKFKINMVGPTRVHMMKKTHGHRARGGFQPVREFR